MTELLFKELTGKIIGVYFDVYNNTSRTYPELVYEKAMVRDLQALGIACSRQPEYRIIYKEWLVGLQQLDLFIAGEVVVELKVAPRLTPLHLAQTFSYLKALGKSVALLLNFGGPKPEFERIFFEPRSAPVPHDAVRRKASELPPDLVSPDLAYEIVGSLFEVHTVLGPGFVHRIYGNACYREMQSRGLPVRPQNEMQVIYRGEAIAPIKFAHLRVGDTALVFPVAVTEIDSIRFNNLKDWLRAQQVPLGILANFQDRALQPVMLRV